MIKNPVPDGTGKEKDFQGLETWREIQNMYFPSSSILMLNIFSINKV